VNTKGAHDVSGIPPLLLKKLSEPLAPVIRLAVNVYLAGQCALPAVWHDCVFVPLLKADKPPEQLNSYRAVAITAVLCRVMERIMAERLTALVRTHLHARQYGFRKMSSTLDAVAALVDECFASWQLPPASWPHRWDGHAIRRAQSVALIGLIDLTNAFPQVPHAMIFAALGRLVVSQYLVDYITEWLAARRGKVFHDGVVSDWKELLAGVPQGSVLGPLLFVLVFDSLLHELEAKCAELSRHAPVAAVQCCFAAYADDLSLCVTSSQTDVLGPTMQELCDVVTGWCTRHGMTISGKTKFCFLDRTHGRVLAFPELTVGPLTFAVEGAPQRLLGLQLDKYATFGCHVERALAAFDDRLLRLRRASKYVRPLFLRPVVYNMVVTLLYLAPVWFHRASQDSRHRVQVAIERACRAGLFAVATTSGAACLGEMGIYPAQHLVTDAMLRLAFLRSTVPGDSPLLHGNIHRVLTRHGGMLPTTWPACPPSPELDKVDIRYQPAVPNVSVKESPPVVRHSANDVQRNAVLAQLPEGAVMFEAWSDGSVMRIHGEDWGGAATVLWRPSGERDRSVLCPAPWHPCSYSAECSGTEQMLATCVDALTEYRTQNPAAFIAVLLLSDGQSWMSHASRGPLIPAVYNPRFWSRVEPLAAVCDKVFVRFMFAHCDDPRGDVVDSAAEAAREQFTLSRTYTTPWHVDMCRPHLQQLRRNTDRALLEQQTFRKQYNDDPMGLPPPKELSRRQAIVITRLRTGVWPPLGWGTVAHGVDAVPCRFCGTLLSRGGGKAIIHMFTCASVPEAPPGSAALIWSEFPEQLFAIIAHVMQFIPAAVAAVAADPQSDEDDTFPIPEAPAAPPAALVIIPAAAHTAALGSPDGTDSSDDDTESSDDDGTESSNVTDSSDDSSPASSVSGGR
jgi:hypothetical protein